MWNLIFSVLFHFKSLVLISDFYRINQKPFQRRQQKPNQNRNLFATVICSEEEERRSDTRSHLAGEPLTLFSSSLTVLCAALPGRPPGCGCMCELDFQ